ncbi:MAG TPA: CBS domain-containing protein [Bacteriovoracaceae bacterium]|nr:CBS domain-containing protein [Bacteriovoracaceae bacterium]
MLIKDIMLPGIKTVSAESTMAEANQIMQNNGFRHLPVSDGKSIIGIISDRDVQRATTVIKNPNTTSDHHIYPHKLVTEYMSSPVYKMKITESVKEVAREMLNRKVSCFLIEDETGKDVGIITTDDLLVLLLDVLDARKPSLFKLLGLGRSRV